MKKDIHPEYHLKSQITCACGNKMAIGSTQEKMETEICSQCHPFYTGASVGARGGRVEKFKSKMEKQKELQANTGKKKERKKSNLTKTAKISNLSSGNKK